MEADFLNVTDIITIIDVIFVTVVLLKPDLDQCFLNIQDTTVQPKFITMSSLVQLKAVGILQLNIVWVYLK